jgi:exopolysaccharide production protein ExoQ
MTETTTQKQTNQFRIFLTRPTTKNDKFGLSFLLFIAILPLVSLYAPRALAFLPGLIALIFLTLQYFYLGKKPHLPKTLLLCAIITCGLAFVSSLWALDFDVAFKRSIKMSAILIPGVFFVSLSRHIPNNIIQKYAILLPAGAFLAIALLSLDYLSDLSLYKLINNIPFDENTKLHTRNRSACVLIVLALPALFCLRSALPSQKHTIPILAALLLLPTFLITASQSAQLALFCGLLIAIAFPYGRKWGWLTLKVMIALLTLTAPWIAMWLFSNYAEAIHALPRMGKGDQSASAGNRLEVWDFVSRYALQNPLYGFGIESTRVVEEFDSQEIFQRGKTILHPHNFALQAWMEFGILGAILMASFLVITLQKIQNKFQYASQRILLPTLCMMLSIGATGYGIWQSWWLGLILTAAAFSLICARFSQAQKEAHSKQEIDK